LGIADRITRDFEMARSFGRALPTLLRARPGGRFTVADAFEERAKRFTNAPALISEDRSISYGELDRAANQVARWAREQGLGTGDVVAQLMGNRPEFVIHWLGLAKLGVVTALINTNLSGRPLAHSLEVSGARQLILDASLHESFSSARNELALPLEVWSSGGIVEGASDLDAERARQPGRALPARVRADLRSEDDLFYIYTSGTTGLPKAAHFSHQRFLAAAIGGMTVSALRPSDRIYIVLPLYHTAGGVMALGGSLLAGAAAVIARRFSASRFWDDCLRHDVTVFQYIGELCRYLLNGPPHPDEQRHRIRLCIGNGLRAEVWEPFQKRFAIPRILEFYGATEGNVSFANLDGKVGSVGRMPELLRQGAGIHLVRFDVEREEVVRDADGFCIECDVDEPGEAIGRLSRLVRFEGYSDTRASEKKILRDVFRRGDAYFRTGDLLRRDDDDYFYFVDRIGDTFRWKGENVSTGEVGEFLSSCPSVKEANVYGVHVPGADGRAGMASLVVAEDFDLEDFGLRVQAELPSYARPLFLRIEPRIEITGTFKHRKVEAVKQGFDPGTISDPLFFFDAKEGRYLPLDEAIHRRIVEGDLRV
jgi:fatty-acyl-CoA synthase